MPTFLHLLSRSLQLALHICTAPVHTRSQRRVHTNITTLDALIPAGASDSRATVGAAHAEGVAHPPDAGGGATWPRPLTRK